MQQGLKILLMAGGKGTRLWPKSRKSTPKQFMSLKPQKTLFQQSVERVSGLTEHTEIFVVAPPEYVPLINQQAPGFSSEHIIVEPCQHSTTACLGYALMHLQSRSLKSDEIILVIPTDAYVDDDESYRSTLLDAIQVARATNGTVTVGIRPFGPETGYGYIEAGQERVGSGIKVDKFIEKPCREDAMNYVQSGNFYWNSGIFAWKASVIFNLFETNLPDCYRKLLILKSLFMQSDPAAIQEQYTHLPKISFEYTIVEKASEIYMVPARFRWADLGSWSSLLKTMGTQIGDQGRQVISLDSEGCLVANERGLVGLLGVHDLIVVNVEDAIFVCHRDREQDLNRFLEFLQAQGFQSYL